MTSSRLLGPAAALAAAVAVTAAAPAPAGPVHVGSWTYENPAPLGGTGAAAALNLGGFSDLFPADGSGREFWTVTDRGPNADAAADSDKIFLKPDYTPQILRIRLTRHHGVKVVERIPLRTPEGQTDPVTGTRLVTGLPPAALTAERPVDVDNQPLPNDPYGVDSEGVVVGRDGSFWVSSEYGSSILNFSREGVLRTVLVPAGSGYDAPGAQVLKVLPAIESKQKNNKGLEGLAVSADGRTLYAAQQTALANPKSKTASTSLVRRIFRVDISRARTPVVDGEFAFLRDADSATDGGWSTSAMIWLGRDRLLVEERDAQLPTQHTDFYEVDLAGATNILGSVWDDPAAAPLETLDPAALAGNGVVPGAKKLVFDAAAAGLPNGKVEGVALLKDRLFLVNDNDFGVAGVTDGAVVPNNVVTRVDEYRLGR